MKNPAGSFTFIETNGIRLHARVAGPEDGPLVVLLHGFPEFWYGWKNQIGPLAEAGFRVVAPDQRGYNLSDKPRGIDAYRIDRVAADIAGLIEALGRERAFVVGHDWGGVAAWTAATLYPGRVEKLVVLNAPYPSVGVRTIARDPTQLLRSLYLFFFQLPGLPEMMLRNNDWGLLVDGMRRSSRRGTFSDADFEAYRQAWWRKGAMTAMLNWYRAFVRRPAPVIPWKPRVRPPTLILWGKNDFALSPVNAKLSLELCENGRLEWIDAGHWVQHEETKWVNEAIIDFLTD